MLVLIILILGCIMLATLALGTKIEDMKPSSLLAVLYIFIGMVSLLVAILSGMV